MPVETKKQLIELIQAHSSEIQALGIRRLGVFGSFVRGEQGPGSDVDVLVEFDPTRKNYENFLALVDHLELILGRQVEIVTPESLSPYLGPRILAEVEYVPLAA